MEIRNGQLLSSVEIPIPQNVLTTAKRQYKGEDLQRFLSIKLYDITYMSDGLQIKGFLALPPLYEEKLPAIQFNRGGSGAKGALTLEGVFSILGMYAAWGYVAIASQYRGQGGSDGSEEWGAGDTNDAKNLTTLLLSLPYVDTDRIGLIAGSRGGMMAFQMLRSMNNFRAAVTFGAPTMLHLLTEREYIIQTFMPFLKNEESIQKALEERSVVVWADELCKTTPLLLLHGTGDRKVHPSHSLELSKVLLDTLQPHKLILYENADHVLAGRRSESNLEIRQWMDRYVKEKSKLPIVGPHGN